MSHPDVLMVGTGEYTTGYVEGSEAATDKRAGVVATTMFDLRRRGIVGRLLMCGTNGRKFPAIRTHLNQAVRDVYRDMDVSFESYPNDQTRNSEAYLMALDCLSPGDAVLVFTPDDTHFRIAMEAVRRKLHVLIAKPLVKSLDEHRQLLDAAQQYNVLVAMEVHKRWDPIYADARDRMRQLGDFSFFQSYMSQPKSQLRTFQAWAGKSSDISYYLNAHHVDFHVWACGHQARPISVRAAAATGIATSAGLPTEDSITLLVEWQNIHSGNRATAVYTASWIAPKSDVHSQQRFFYMGHAGEVTVDQAHRGYSVATDSLGYQSVNPLFMKFEPDANGHFVGQTGYGYRSIEAFVSGVSAIRHQQAKPADFDGQLATVNDTLWVTAILEAGRISLDQDRTVRIQHNDRDNIILLDE
ncbi:MAG: Gfo/Idh/MocA family oxidoreductase [Planctomycetales bacterium]|nr:Gfo/Idh/MocA family oxidoreductase [Planctomycetales bacterium]